VKTSYVREKARLVHILAAVAVIAAGLAVSRSYFLRKEQQRSARERLETLQTGSFDGTGQPGRRAIADWLRDPWVILEIKGTMHCSMVVYAFGLMLMQTLRNRRTLGDVIRQPGTASCLCCITVFTTGFLMALLTWLTRTASSPHSASNIAWWGLIGGLEETVGKATLAVWVVLISGKCARYRRGAPEAIAVILGIVWIGELFVTSVVVGLL